nr:Pr6Pr family membrane protein [uncultured Flavobacterium sp.]
MKRLYPLLVSALAWFAIISQLVIMLQTRQVELAESLIRFFSYFTILTNLAVALLFGLLALGKQFAYKWLTPVTVYILVVGLVYQVALRHVWHPQGLQKIVDELLHSVVPFMAVVYWGYCAGRLRFCWSNLVTYLIYPAVYCAYILVRGCFSGFYPYYFMNVSVLGGITVTINSFIILLVFVVLSCLFIGIGKWVTKPKQV